MLNSLINPSKPLALGIHWAHDASVAICSPEGILCTIAEERIARIKHYYGFPCRAIETALRYCGLSGSDIDFVAFSTKKALFPQHTNYMIVDADGTLASVSEVSFYLNKTRRRIKQVLRNGQNFETPNQIARNWNGFEDRHWSKYADFLADLGLFDKRIKYYYIAHHRAHAASAFRLSGLQEACVLTIDGKGDGLSATIYKGHPDGSLELLRSSKAQDSIGAFYQAITEALGFIPVDGEYKTMGLAALGHDNGKENPFASILRVEDGIFKSTIPWTYRNYNEYNPSKKVPNPLVSVAQTDRFKKLLDDMPPERFAYLAQAHSEENMLSYVRDAIRLTECDKIAGAGGVMLNVKANALIRDRLEPACLFIFPDAADSGLATGAAMEALYQADVLRNSANFRNPYLGHSFSDEEICREIMRSKQEYGFLVIDGGNENPGLVADHLVHGKVIGTFQGRLEMGPRALGNRSVLADARSETMKDRINRLLKGRDWFVPFAPVVLEEDASLFWDGPIDYRYMTMSVRASDYAKKTVPAVVHVDGSMRPQVVSPEYNPWLYKVLQEYKKRTGVGVLINTSFNRHGLPIVGAPADALHHLINGWVDGLIIGRWYLERGTGTH